MKEREPLRIKPHHAEGAQRYIRYGKENHREMYELFTSALEKDPDAEVVFTRGVDPICKSCIADGYGSEQCANSADTVNIDEEVAEVLGWEFDKVYKVRDILEYMEAEAPKRDAFYFCKLTKDEYERWLADVQRWLNL